VLNAQSRQEENAMGAEAGKPARESGSTPRVDSFGDSQGMIRDNRRDLTHLTNRVAKDSGPGYQSISALISALSLS
jgi:hypothetical protein